MKRRLTMRSSGHMPLHWKRPGRRLPDKRLSTWIVPDSRYFDRDGRRRQPTKAPAWDYRAAREARLREIIDGAIA